MQINGLLKLIWLLVFIEITYGRTVTRHETTIKANGDKVTKSWTTTDESEEQPIAHHYPYASFQNEGTGFHIEPESETIQIGGYQTPEELIKQAALTRGMDPEAITELLQTKQPVVKTTVDVKGQTRTTTYKLQPDGSISSRTVTQMKPVEWHSGILSLDDTRRVSRPKYNIGHVPLEEQLNSQEPGTKSYLSNDGQLFLVDTPNKESTRHHSKFESIFEKDEPKEMFEDIKPPTWVSKPTQVYSSTRTFSSSDPTAEIFERRHKPVEETETTFFKRPTETWQPNNWRYQPTSDWYSNTFPGNNEDRKVPDFPQWYKKPAFDTMPNHFFDSVETQTPKAVTQTLVDDSELKVTSTPVYSQTDTSTRYPTSSSTVPSLDAFLKSEYETTTKPSTAEITTTTKSLVKPPLDESLVDNFDKRPITKIKMEDLPIVEILNNGKPVDEHVLKTLPPALRPIEGANVALRPLKVENIPKTENFNNDLNTELRPKEQVDVRTYTGTVHTNGKPTIEDLNPSLQEILRKAGIRPEDISSSSGNAISKTRTEPDGRTITTTYSVRTVPTTDQSNDLGVPITSKAYNNPLSSYNYNQITPVHENTFRKVSNFNPIAKNPINEYLSKVGLNSGDLISKNGQYRKTIIDDEGRILSVLFVLSTVKGSDNASNALQESSPLK